MNITIKNYNDLVPFMNDLEDLGYRVDDFCNNYEGYGFYAEGKNNHYVDVHIHGNMMYVNLKKHNSGCRHDIINDIEVASSGELNDVDLVKQKVIEYLLLSGKLGRTYKVDLTADEINTLTMAITDENIINKLKNSLQN